ncbi:Hypothetical Protein CGB_B1270W [Cryptococcus gattii WM276]|uniref:Uncharacterized protein n=2 Tax=Cryptococcus gattii TaxID=37769 RepID=E6QZZ7_CRYGW|nr:Hypothetical Protein CGB_B1270W [Cryptococcus gattii WM276]ADV20145.1 Hypothetical Protein CGB_B1270W [Cryptococcus gattii WM276]KIR77459.1 hypothetical protein I306_05653 [Cryptococcus gattii EJB2]KJE05975.1 hypothetical protein I311_00111 [Cryptococcus gattii NT-10]
MILRNGLLFVAQDVKAALPHGLMTETRLINSSAIHHDLLDLPDLLLFHLIKCALCGETLPRQLFIADGKLHDACMECRRTIPPSRIPFTGDVDALAIAQHSIDSIKTFHSECKKITVDTCIN